MALRNIHSRLWLIPVFMVLLLLGCGNDIGLVNGDDHARVTVDAMPAANVVIDTTIEPPTETDPGTSSWEFSGNEMVLSVHNNPRLGDADMIGGGLLAEVEYADVTIIDSSGVSWERIYGGPAIVVEPGTSQSVPFAPLFPMVLQNEIVRRFLTEADFYTNAQRLELSGYTVIVKMGIREYTYDGYDVETYTVTHTGSAHLTHTGDYIYAP